MLELSEEVVDLVHAFLVSRILVRIMVGVVVVVHVIVVLHAHLRVGLHHWLLLVAHWVHVLMIHVLILIPIVLRIALVRTVLLKMIHLRSSFFFLNFQFRLNIIN